jgi:hypothetical protein
MNDAQAADLPRMAQDARQAAHGNLAVELSGIERQPGVRRTL